MGDYLSLLYIGESRFITGLFLYAVFARAAGLSPDASMQPIFIASLPFHRVSQELFQTCLGFLVAVPGVRQGAHYPASSPGASCLQPGAEGAYGFSSCTGYLADPGTFCFSGTSLPPLYGWKSKNHKSVSSPPGLLE